VDRDALARGPRSLWRYAPLLPTENPSEAVTLGEGWTPLIPVPRLGKALGLHNLYVKDEGRNPSGSFKDRGASVAVSRYRELGIRTVVHASSGNAAAAWSLYAARAGIECVNVLPQDALDSSLVQCVLAGARTVIYAGPWQDSRDVAQAATARHGWFDVMTLREPYRMEGKKTIGLELAEQLGWRLPDVLVYPVGSGLGPLAIFKAFRELQELGWVGDTTRPRLVAAQYEGCAPIVKAWRENRERAEPWPHLDVLPGGLKGARPAGDRALLALLRATGGAAHAVSTSDALAAAAEMTAEEGVFPAPESAITFAAARMAVADGTIRSEETVVLVVTATGLKSIANFAVPPVERLPVGGTITAGVPVGARSS
jgi:threonine synthase